MPIQIAILLLVVFGIHFTVFLTLYCKKRKRAHLLVAFIFLLLIVSTILRKWFPELRVCGIALFWPIRIASWIGSAALVINRLKRK